jgi:hypothetical protein
MIHCLFLAENNSDDLKKLKVSYDTLRRFSFLTHNEKEFTKDIASETRDHMKQLFSKTGDVTISSCESTQISTSSEKSENSKKLNKSITVHNSKQTNSIETINNSEPHGNQIDPSKTSTQTLESTRNEENSVKTLHKNFFNSYNQEIFDDDDVA